MLEMTLVRIIITYHIHGCRAQNTVGKFLIN